MKTTLTLNFQEVQALDYFLCEILSGVGQDYTASLYIKMQLELLGELRIGKIYPKTGHNTGKPVKIKLKPAEATALQLAVMQGWLSMCPDLYTQNAIRLISIQQLPRVTVTSSRQLLPPDVWEEE